MDVRAHLEQTFPQGSTSMFVLSGAGFNELECAHMRFPSVEILRKPVRFATLFQAILAIKRPI